MIDPRELSDVIRLFIATHEKADVPTLVLKYKAIDGLPISSVADQIIGRRKSREKLPTYYAQPDVLYPPTLNLEQTSSELAATYKAKLVASASEAHTIVDLTGGFGVDAFAFSKVFRHVIHVEPDTALQRLAVHAHRQLGRGNISYVNQTAEGFLPSMPAVSAVYIDPSRRKNSRKVHSFHDCQPDLTMLQDRIFGKTSVLLVKASPMHDIKLALREIRHVKRVIVVAVDNEVRELLFLALRNFDSEPAVSALNITDSGTVALDFLGSEEDCAEAVISERMEYLYEPNAAILKAGAFKLISVRYGVHKLHVNTHLYTAHEKVVDFPGRIFRVVAGVKGDDKVMRAHLPEGKANIVVRNYPASPEELKKKLKLQDGDEKYLLAFTSARGPELVVADRLT